MNSIVKVINEKIKLMKNIERRYNLMLTKYISFRDKIKIKIFYLIKMIWSIYFEQTYLAQKDFDTLREYYHSKVDLEMNN